MQRHLRHDPVLVLIVCLSLGIDSICSAQEPSVAAESPPAKLEFNRDIRPILSDKCYFCHGPDSGHRKAELRLDTSAGARAEHDGRQAVVAGNPELSELISRITSDDDNERMPPLDSGKVLSPREIATLKAWIEQGAEYQPHWSYLAPRRSSVPEVRNPAWPLNPIDHFLLARLEADGLKPASDADRITLIRRVTLDLTGLLPTTLEVDAFLADTSANAFEKVVDRLLASPHFGERMAIYWLDLVRFANTVGYHGDQEHAITPYRDYVIDSFNHNMPFDQFTREQIAGDLLATQGTTPEIEQGSSNQDQTVAGSSDLDRDAKLRQRVASGYNRLLQTSHEGGVQVKEYLHKYDADRVRNLSSVWLGATLGCAECHNHKFDPYTQKSFYELVAFFADVDDIRSFNGGNSNPTAREPEIVVMAPLDQLLIQQLERELSELRPAAAPTAPMTQKAKTPSNFDQPNSKPLVPTAETRINAVQEQLDTLRKRGRRTMVTEAIKPKVVRVLNRGDWMDETGEIVEPSVPEFLPGIAPKTGQRLNRLDLANWLMAPENPLTSRVFTNRLWYLYFGTGLVNSLDDFGAQGEWPTHPQLLDWLAMEFRESGWDIKHLTRIIVTSRVYRQSSTVTPFLNHRDPENRLFARQSQYRLPAEMIRDTALQSAGLLIHRTGGSGHPYQPVGYYQFLNFPKREYQADKDDNQYRRGVYLHWQRQYLHPMLKAFDASTREECSVRRPLSNTPLAALTLLNDPTFLEAAKMFAGRIVREGGASTSDRINWAWKTILIRSPGPTEIASIQALYDFSLKNYRDDPAAAKSLLSIGLAKPPPEISEIELAAWTNVARTLLNLHEVITRN